MVEAFVVLENGARLAEADGARLVPWWSFSKAIIAATALRLADQGRLRLDHPADVSLLTLLRHEARLPDYGGLRGYHRAVAAGDPPWTAREMQARVEAEPALGVTAAWSYSNIGYLRARELIEAAGGDGLGALARAALFDPLGLAGVRFAATPTDLADVSMGAAAGYDPRWVFHGLFAGPLAEAATLLDRLLDARTSPLSEASRRLLLAPHDLPQHRRSPWSATAYGTGMMLPHLADGAPVAGHTGGGPGSTIAVYRRMAGPVRTAAAFAFEEGQAPVEHDVAGRLQAAP